MDILSNLRYAEGSKKKKKRVGRGQGSGHGGTSTRGHKGQHSRSGAKFRGWFEGGQMPLQRRVPKFGFTNHMRTEHNILNLDDLQTLIDSGKLSEGKIDKEMLIKNKIIRGLDKPLKILGNGELKAKVEITADSFSKAAVEKIEKGGGKAIKL
jgi:large subunit ribosomal protein L15